MRKRKFNENVYIPLSSFEPQEQEDPAGNENADLFSRPDEKNRRQEREYHSPITPESDLEQAVSNGNAIAMLQYIENLPSDQFHYLFNKKSRTLADVALISGCHELADLLLSCGIKSSIQHGVSRNRTNDIIALYFLVFHGSERLLAYALYHLNYAETFQYEYGERLLSLAANRDHFASLSLLSEYRESKLNCDQHTCKLLYNEADEKKSITSPASEDSKNIEEWANLLDEGDFIALPNHRDAIPTAIEKPVKAILQAFTTKNSDLQTLFLLFVPDIGKICRILYKGQQNFLFLQLMKIETIRVRILYQNLRGMINVVLNEIRSPHDNPRRSLFGDQRYQALIDIMSRKNYSQSKLFKNLKYRLLHLNEIDRNEFLKAFYRSCGLMQKDDLDKCCPSDRAFICKMRSKLLLNDSKSEIKYGNGDYYFPTKIPAEAIKVISDFLGEGQRSEIARQYPGFLSIIINYSSRLDSDVLLNLNVLLGSINEFVASPPRSHAYGLAEASDTPLTRRDLVMRLIKCPLQECIFIIIVEILVLLIGINGIYQEVYEDRPDQRGAIVRAMFDRILKTLLLCVPLLCLLRIRNFFNELRELKSKETALLGLSDITLLSTDGQAALRQISASYERIPGMMTFSQLRSFAETEIAEINNRADDSKQSQDQQEIVLNV